MASGTSTTAGAAPGALRGCLTSACALLLLGPDDPRAATHGLRVRLRAALCDILDRSAGALRSWGPPGAFLRWAAGPAAARPGRVAVKVQTQGPPALGVCLVAGVRVPPALVEQGRARNVDPKAVFFLS